MVDGIVAGSDGEDVLCALGSLDFDLLVILQVERSALLTGQVQTVESNLRLALCLEDELSVVAFALQEHGELVAFVQAFDIHRSTVDGYRYAVTEGLFYLCLLTFIIDDDVLGMTDAGHHGSHAEGNKEKES